MSRISARLAISWCTRADIGREQHRAAGAADAQVRARRLQVSIQGLLSMLTQYLEPSVVQVHVTRVIKTRAR